jgi:hypothetical protein
MGFRMFGEPPGRDAPEEARLRWTRRFYLRPLPVALAVYGLAVLVASETWQYAVLAAAALFWLQGLVSISLRIRRVAHRAHE